MKFPHIRSLGREDGWYRVGPLAQLNYCDFIGTPLAEAARKEFMARRTRRPRPCDAGLPLGAADQHDPLRRDDQANCCSMMTSREPTWWSTGDRRPEGVAIIEAPRGTLLHHYQVDDNDQVTMANLIVSTTNNNEAMNRSVTKVAIDDLPATRSPKGC